MLVVKVEIWPMGEVKEAFEIARVGIDNRSPGKACADYGVTALMARDTAQEYVLEDEVHGHMRSHGWEPLVASAVAQLITSDRAVPVEGRGLIVDLLKELPVSEDVSAPTTDTQPVDQTADVVLNEAVSWVLEVLKDGVWTPFTAQKTDPEDVVRTYNFSVNRDPDERLRIVEVRTTIRQVGIIDVALLVSPKS